MFKRLGHRSSPHWHDTIRTSERTNHDNLLVDLWSDHKLLLYHTQETRTTREDLET